MSDVRNGLKFPVVALPGVGHMPTPGEDEKEAARVFYAAASNSTRSTMSGLKTTVDDAGFVAFSALRFPPGAILQPARLTPRCAITSTVF